MGGFFCVWAVTMSALLIGLNQVDPRGLAGSHNTLLQNLAEIFCKTLQHLFFFLYLHL